MSAATSTHQIMDQAADWLIAAQDRPNDPQLRAQIQTWVAADPAHGRAWDKVRTAWSILGDAPASAPEAEVIEGEERPDGPIVQSLSDWRDRAVRRRWAGGALAGLAVAASLAMMLSPSLMLKLRADHATMVAEISDVSLPDGSRVRLGARSAINVDFSGRDRVVRLVAGDAWFDVVHDAARPFIVRSDRLETRVLGTAFEVQQNDVTSEVGVGRGRVRVTAATGTASADLLPGNRIIFDIVLGTVRRETVPVDSIATWRDGHIFANNATVAQVVDQLRRYDYGWIVLADEAVGSRRVTGLYDARNPEQVLAALVETSGGSMRRITPLLHIISAR